MKNKKVQWHPGFVAAITLELKQNRENLLIQSEYNLNTKPLEVDVLIIRKEKTEEIRNEIGRFFRGHNLLEYKSPEDHLDVDTFYKVTAYAGLYKSYGKNLDERKADDITITFVREKRPEGLFRYFREHGHELLKSCEGIYQVKGNVLFPTQMVVTGELDVEKHTWLRALSGKVEKETAGKVLKQVRLLEGKEERELADSVLKVMLEANRKKIEIWKGDGDMFETLMEIMEPQIQMREVKIRMEERTEGIRGTVEALREFGHGDGEIKTVLMKKYGLTEEEAKGYLMKR